MDEKKETNFLVKVGTIRSRSYASSLFLKADDIIVALNNELYIFGEKKLVSELKELKKEGEKAILTVLRGDTFFDLIIENSLGCKFVTTTAEETQKIRQQFSSKENFDIDELQQYSVMRDAFRKYDVFSNSHSLMAGLFPPLWLIYAQKWWVLSILIAFSCILLVANPFIFLFGWLLTSIYCYKAQLNLLYSFSMLEGKVFCLSIAAKSIDHAHKIIREIDPKSKFQYSKLPHPKLEEVEEVKDEKNQNNSDSENIIDEKKEALV